jgi:hypothetical protein
MRLFLLAPILLLTGCFSRTTVVVDTKWPNVPNELKTHCPELKLLDADDQKLSSLVSTVGSNYTEYLLCKNRVDSWIDWYNDQKKIKESVK